MTLLHPKTALLSVSDKAGLADFAKALQQDFGISLLSTGGTHKTLSDKGLEVNEVANVTGFPEIMNGRVKTLHPKIHGGILADRSKPDHLAAMKEHDINGIDIVVINLYPFAETLKKGGSYQDCVENIDIGGPAMLRAAAKNHAHVAIITDPNDYALVLKELKENKGGITFETRKKLAQKAFALTAAYDAMIAEWLAGDTQTVTIKGSAKQTLRYGENPHQTATLYADGSNRTGVLSATQLQGKELSYNNINDTDAAFELVSEFIEPAVAIIKHANPCGVATGKDIETAYKAAFRCDPVSAFGGIIALNRPLTAQAATLITEIFSEVIIAPSIEEDAKAVLAKKKNLRVLVTGTMAEPSEKRPFIKSIAGGFLYQDADTMQVTKDMLKTVTKRAPSPQELEDMLFAFRIAKHVKSNAIIYAKDLATVGIGAGQMSRLDSARIAVRKASEIAEREGLKDNPTIGAVVASDAFFPFADGLIAAAEAGVTAVIQPGGSIRDDEVIAAANERNLAMVFTNIRHFRH
ncbi:MAG: bifunctional phosphoribosylaminoimidazolecarboxamide formyltransferase/inosine monophosphate cyclohydrolase [Micavibrio sp.]|nr:bifunctional phosphoribosylaminoimidazolecarboxamide formyltransferase/inosine monophosphate cyclohydrolase [Micavibrio sp.]